MSTIAYLKVYRDQLLKLKTIFITVNSIEEAYTIFETLNAKGKDLLTIDLIKNKVFKLLDTDHPDDDAKTKWGSIKKELGNKPKRVNPSTFLRHYWISKYEFVNESKIYESFSRKIPENSSYYKLFLDGLVDGAKEYNKIANPSENDWKTLEEKRTYFSLMALITFNVVQPRPFILALFDARKRKLITINHMSEVLSSIEKFHFLFSAVCSSRASGLEGKYSTLARKLRRTKSKTDAKIVLKELDSYFESKKPTLQVFVEGFKKLEFLNDKTADKKLIQYIFFNIEKEKYSTEELIPYNLTIEHIYPQSKESVNKGEIGNLIPLALEINEAVKIWNLDKKLPEFAKSELKTVKEFVDEYSEKEKWTDELTDLRTNIMAEHTYNVVWR
jgi:hypothetical protein